MRSPIQKAIATRIFRQQRPREKTFVLRIGEPRRVSAVEWECAFHVTDAGMRGIRYGHGIDGRQARIQAIEGARAHLEKMGVGISWVGGDEGDAGIPRYVPQIYGNDFTAHLYKLIDRELDRFAHSAEQRYKRRAR